jgi:chromosome segregation ATPase
METYNCHTALSKPASRISWFLSIITVFESPMIGWVLLTILSFILWRLWYANMRLLAQQEVLQDKCAEHERVRQQSAGSIGTWRSRSLELESELDEARVQIGESDLRVAQLQGQVEDLLRTRKESRLSLSFSRADCLRTEVACKSMQAEKASVVAELSSERRTSDELRSEIQKLRQLLGEARKELSYRNSFAAEVCDDDSAIKRTAELMVMELPRTADPLERQRAQRQLLTCLHPDKCPSNHVGTRLMQEVQRSVAWVAASTHGGA